MINYVSTRRVAFLLASLAASTALGIIAINIHASNASVIAADPDVRVLTAANTDFGFRLLHCLTLSQPTGNVFFSPLSISSALSMTLNGAGGQTQKDMAKTLGLEAVTVDKVNHASSLLLPSLTNPDPKVKVLIANALWADHRITLAPEFQERCHRFYAARAESLNLSSPEAVAAINGWVGENTGGKISQLVTQNDLDGAAVVLTNAIYFHGLWQTPFDKASTQDAPFALAGGGTKMVPMMCQDDQFSSMETPQYQAVSLPYGNGRMSLDVLLPKVGKASVEGLVKSLNSRTWASHLAQMKPTSLTLFLPRFKAQYAERLRGPLSSLGMRAAFQPGADFLPMGSNRWYIGDVIHKAVLDVDEEGTTAAAATAVIMTKSARVSPTTVMRVDHPFFLAIRDNVTGTILFEGLIRGPQ